MLNQCKANRDIVFSQPNKLYTDTHCDEARNIPQTAFKMISNFGKQTKNPCTIFHIILQLN